MSRIFEGDRFHPALDSPPSATGGTTTLLIDTKYAASVYQDDHFVNWEVRNQTQSWRTFCTAFDGDNGVWTTPTQSSASASGDVYECHNRAGPLSVNYDDAIDLAIQAAARNEALANKADYSLAYQRGRVFYPIPSSFSYVHGIWADQRNWYVARHWSHTFDGLSGIRDTTAHTKVAQGFVFRNQNPTPILGDVYILLSQIGTISSGTLTMTIETDSSGSPSGAAIATSAAVTASGLTAEPTFQRFTFTAKPSLTNGTTYWMVVTGTYTVSTTNYIAWGNDTDAGYSEGQPKTHDGVATWTALTGDLIFMVRGQTYPEYVHLHPRKHFTVLDDGSRYVALTDAGASVLWAMDGSPLVLLGQGSPSLPTADSDTLEIPYDYAVARGGLILADQNPEWLGQSYNQRVSTWKAFTGDLEAKMSTGLEPGAIRVGAM